MTNETIDDILCNDNVQIWREAYNSVGHVLETYPKGVLIEETNAERDALVKAREVLRRKRNDAIAQVVLEMF